MVDTKILDETVASIFKISKKEAWEKIVNDMGKGG
jgi:hypothetical protein